MPPTPGAAMNGIMPTGTLTVSVPLARLTLEPAMPSIQMPEFSTPGQGGELVRAMWSAPTTATSFWNHLPSISPCAFGRAPARNRYSRVPTGTLSGTLTANCAGLSSVAPPRSMSKALRNSKSCGTGIGRADCATRSMETVRGSAIEPGATVSTAPSGVATAPPCAPSVVVPTSGARTCTGTRNSAPL